MELRRWLVSLFFDLTNYRPAAVVKIRAGLSDAGKIVSWVHQVFAAGPRDAFEPWEASAWSG